GPSGGDSGGVADQGAVGDKTTGGLYRGTNWNKPQGFALLGGDKVPRLYGPRPLRFARPLAAHSPWQARPQCPARSHGGRLRDIAGIRSTRYRNRAATC